MDERDFKQINKELTNANINLHKIRILLDGKKVKAEKYFTCDKYSIYVSFDKEVNKTEYIIDKNYYLCFRFSNTIIEIGHMKLIKIQQILDNCILQFQ